MALADVTLPKLPTRFDRVLEKVRLLLGGKPEAVQVAALPWRRNAEGRVEILMATSRDTGRWVLPKGWPKSGFDAGLVFGLLDAAKIRLGASDISLVRC